jgi:predicted amidohydrolase
MKISLWIYDLAKPCASYYEWIGLVSETVEVAAGKGSRLLIMPELVGLHWAAHIGAEGRATAHVISLIAGMAHSLIDDLTALAKRHRIYILAGSFPRYSGDGIVNRALLVGPEGLVVEHDKLCLTPIEKTVFGFRSGESLTVFELDGWRGVILTCLDVEQPWLACQLGALDVDFVLVPSMTMTADGYHRVFSCSKSRAVELQAAICVVGAVGNTPYTAFHATNYSGAAVYVPCEADLGNTGILLETPPRPTSQPGIASELAFADLPLDTIRAMRKGKARVWPGAWRPSEAFQIKHSGRS